MVGRPRRLYRRRSWRPRRAQLDRRRVHPSRVARVRDRGRDRRPARHLDGDAGARRRLRADPLCGLARACTRPAAPRPRARRRVPVRDAGGLRSGQLAARGGAAIRRRARARDHQRRADDRRRRRLRRARDARRAAQPRRRRRGAVRASRARRGARAARLLRFDGAPALEDVYLAGRISSSLAGERSDAARIAEGVAHSFRSSAQALAASAHARVLRASGMSADIAHCSLTSVLDCLPVVVSAGAGVAVVADEAAARHRSAPRRPIDAGDTVTL